MPHDFDKEYWDTHWSRRHAPGRIGPNPHLLAQAAELSPGRALDAGCGDGAEAV